MENSPLNFGFGGGMAVLNAVQPQMPWQDPQYGGSVAAWMASQAQNPQYGSAGSPQFQAQAQADAAAATDPNNLSATGIGAPNTTYSSMDPLSPEASGVATTPTVTNDVTGIGAVPTTVSTGSFTPQVQGVAQGIYGDQAMRDASLQKRKLINLI